MIKSYKIYPLGFSHFLKALFLIDGIQQLPLDSDHTRKVYATDIVNGDLVEKKKKEVSFNIQ